jgi:putative photosynthetic complex assembly protein 2
VFDLLFPIGFAVAVWWASTGAILYLDSLARSTYPITFAVASLVVTGAIYGLHDTATATDSEAYYLAFVLAIVVWGWVELSFLTGLITGPRRDPCPAGVSVWRRAVLGFQTVTYHELALIVALAIVWCVTSHGNNPVAWWTILILWLMRQSAKLNVFLGVRNLSIELLPQHLRYLGSYLRQQPSNPLLPWSITVATVAATMLWVAAIQQSDASSMRTALALVASLTTLGMLEHCFLVLPLSMNRLWAWVDSRARESIRPPC